MKPRVSDSQKDPLKMGTQCPPSRKDSVHARAYVGASAVLLLALQASLPGMAFGQHLRLIENPTDGRGIPYGPPRNPTVCKAYLDNLNALPKEMECGRGVRPDSKDFRKPEWRRLNPVEHEELIRKMERRMYPKNPGDDEAWLTRFRARVQENSVALSVAELDVINDDGIPEKVVKYEPLGACRDDSPRYLQQSGAGYFVVDERLKDFAPQFREQIFLIPGVRHDAFIYRGKVYFDFISEAAGPSRRKLVVQEAHANLPPTPVCSYGLSETK